MTLRDRTVLNKMSYQVEVVHEDGQHEAALPAQRTGQHVGQETAVPT